MIFKDLNFVNGKCQLDYNYYVLSFSQIENEKLYECAVFNRAKLPVDLPSVKTEKIKNNKWVKIHFTKTDVEDMLNKFSVEDMHNSANDKIGVCRYANIMPIQN